MHYVIGTFPFHKHGFLSVDCMIFVLFHPTGNALVPLSSCLACTVHAFHQHTCMSFWYWFRPPIGGSNVYLFVSDITIQEGLLGVCLE